MDARSKRLVKEPLCLHEDHNGTPQLRHQKVLIHNVQISIPTSIHQTYSAIPLPSFNSLSFRWSKTPDSCIEQISVLRLIQIKIKTVDLEISDHINHLRCG